MSKWIIEVDVDEDDLRLSAAESCSEEDLEEMDVEAMIYQEMAWVGQSGIHTENVKPKEDGV